MSDNLPQTQTPVRQGAMVTDAEALFDTAQFEHMARIASTMAKSSLIPDHLAVKVTHDGALVPKNYNGAVFIDREATAANCFLIVNQARLFGGIDPFALAQVSYFVHGRLGYEGKLVQAVLERKIGAIRFEYFGTAGQQSYGIKVSALQPGTDREVSISGTVAEWQTSGNNGVNKQWQGPAGQTRMLHYRGTREWARMYAPGLVLGLLDDDDLDALREDHRARSALPVNQLSSSTSGAALAQIEDPKRFNPMEDDEEETQEPAKPEPAPIAAAAPATPPTATVGPASPAPAVETPAAPSGDRRAPRGTPARVDQALMRIAEAKTIDAVEEAFETHAHPLMVEMKGLGVNFAAHEDKLREARAVRIALLEEEARKAGAAAAGANPETGELPQAEAAGDILARFRDGALTVQTFEALDDLVEEVLNPHALPREEDEEAERIIESTRQRIVAAQRAAAVEATTKGPGDAANEGDFPGDREAPPAEGETRNAEQSFPGDVEQPAQGETMTDEAIQDVVDSWSTGMRKCKTAAELEAYNAEVITPFKQGPNGERITKDQLDDARTTYVNRHKLLSRKEAEQGPKA